jgi:hypothetical protein
MEKNDRTSFSGNGMTSNCLDFVGISSYICFMSWDIKDTIYFMF